MCFDIFPPPPRLCYPLTPSDPQIRRLKTRNKPRINSADDPIGSRGTSFSPPSSTLPLSLLIIYNQPVLNPALPIRYSALLDPHNHHPYIITFDVATSRPTFQCLCIRRLPSKESRFFPRLVPKGVIGQMGLLAPLLLLTPLLYETCFARDGRRDAAQRTRVEVQQEAGETAARCGGGWTAFSASGGVAVSCWG